MMIPDKALNFSLINYYIDRESQARQLEENGFELLEVYNSCGRKLAPDENDMDSSWLYYVARKK